jgi:hypothetical protein
LKQRKKTLIDVHLGGMHYFAHRHFASLFSNSKHITKIGFVNCTGIFEHTITEILNENPQLIEMRILFCPSVNLQGVREFLDLNPHIKCELP